MKASGSKIIVLMLIDIHYVTAAGSEAHFKFGTHYMKYFSEIARGNVGSVSTFLYMHEFDAQSVRTL